VKKIQDDGYVWELTFAERLQQHFVTDMGACRCSIPMTPMFAAGGSFSLSSSQGFSQGGGSQAMQFGGGGLLATQVHFFSRTNLEFIPVLLWFNG
jgi:hypothetical protein